MEQLSGIRFGIRSSSSCMGCKIKIDLVTLESTNQVPLTINIREQWAKSESILVWISLVNAMVPPLVHFSTNSTYYLWDVLTTAFVGNTSLAKTETINSIVHTYGPPGRTEETTDGRPVNVVYDVKHDVFFEYITELAKKALLETSITRKNLLRMIYF